VLKLEKVGVQDNFFELGGDSIRSVQVIARAKKAGLQLTTRDIFQHQTITALATLAEKVGSKPKVAQETFEIEWSRSDLDKIIAAIDKTSQRISLAAEEYHGKR
jgi:aryl carrier-like protein